MQLLNVFICIILFNVFFSILHPWPSMYCIYMFLVVYLIHNIHCTQWMLLINWCKKVRGAWLAPSYCMGFQNFVVSNKILHLKKKKLYTYTFINISFSKTRLGALSRFWNENDPSSFDPPSVFETKTVSFSLNCFKSITVSKFLWF